MTEDRTPPEAMNIDAAPDAAPAGATGKPEKASWRFEQGDEIVPGRFALKRLGGGSTYEAYIAWDETLFSLVVVKCVRPDRVESSSALRMIEAEAELLRSLSHPSLVRMFDVVPDGPRPHIVLEHIEGPTLHRLLRKFGALPLEQWLPLALHLCSVAHYMSARGYVHLDIKPGNIVMHSPPRLIDLSVARTIERAAAITGNVGTDAYMAPEQCAPTAGAIGAAADVWGIGATLHHALTNKLPYPKGTPDERFPQLRLDAEVATGIDAPREVIEALRACLHREPALRAKPAEIARMLEPVVAGLPRKPFLGRRRPRLR